MSLSPQGNGPGKIGTSGIADGAVTNAKVNASAAIAKSKISSTGTWTAAEIPNLSATKITSDQLALANGGTGTDLTGKTIAVLEDTQTFTAQQTFDEDIVREGGITIKKINKRAVFSFTGKILDVTNIWTLTDVTGTGATAVIQDGIDEGVRVTTPASLNARATLSHANKRHWNPANCIIWGIYASQNVTVGTSVGINDDTSFAGGGDSVCIEQDTDLSFVTLLGRDGTGVTRVTTDIANSANKTTFKIICSATDQKLYLLIGGVWTLKATQSTRLPTGDCQPFVDVITKNSTANYVDVSYMEIVNLTN